MCSIADISNDWYELKNFDDVPERIKKGIKEIKKEITYDKEGDKTEHLTVKFHDKKGSIDALSKMMGYNIDRLDITTKGEKIIPKTQEEKLEMLEKIAEAERISVEDLMLREGINIE